MMESAIFTDRELKEIYFALIYAHEFKHGTDGHNRLLLIARLAEFCPDEDVKQLVGMFDSEKDEAKT